MGTTLERKIRSAYPTADPVLLVDLRAGKKRVMHMIESIADIALLSRCRLGDDSAAQAIFDRYVERLHALARRRLSQRLSSRVDPEDIVQSVFRTFFGRLKEGQFKINDQDDLCKLLVRITVHKTLRQVAFHRADKRNPHSEVGQTDSGQARLLELLDREPTPEETAAFLDQLEHFLSRLRPQEREILEMRMQGFSNEEIAKKLGIYDRKIRRIVERVRGVAEAEGLSPQQPQQTPEPAASPTPEPE